MKVLVDAKSDQILGFTMFGVMAGEVMATVQVAMLGGMPYTAPARRRLHSSNNVGGIDSIILSRTAKDLRYG